MRSKGSFMRSDPSCSRSTRLALLSMTRLARLLSWTSFSDHTFIKTFMSRLAASSLRLPSLRMRPTTSMLATSTILVASRQYSLNIQRPRLGWSKLFVRDQREEPLPSELRFKSSRSLSSFWWEISLTGKSFRTRTLSSPCSLTIRSLPVWSLETWTLLRPSLWSTRRCSKQIETTLWSRDFATQSSSSASRRSTSVTRRYLWRILPKSFQLIA